MNDKKEIEKRDRSKRFKYLAKKRLGKVKERLALIANLSDKTNYSYTKEDVKELTHELNSAVRETMMKFGKKGKKVEERFKFYLDLDIAQHKALKISDPELFKYINKLDKSSALANYFNNKEKANEELEVPEFLSGTNQYSDLGDLHFDIGDLLSTIEEMNNQIKQIQEKLLKIK